MKRCTKCGVEKPLEAFVKHREGKDGRGWWCKDCVRAASKAARLRKLDHYRAANRAWNNQNKERIYGYMTRFKERQAAKQAQEVA